MSIRDPLIAFGSSVPIGAAGGLIGLGGAEFRLPVLAGPLRLLASRAVPLNLAVSLVTIATSAVLRVPQLPESALDGLAWPMAGLVAGGLVGAFTGTSIARHLTDRRLSQAILVLLLVLGTILILEAFLPDAIPAVFTGADAALFLAGAVAGVAVGIVSSLLGVAGGELLVPLLALGFGADIKVAGTASLLVSLPVVILGIARYAQARRYEAATLGRIGAPMAAGSIIGAAIGAALLPFVPGPALKVALGIILIVSAIRVFGERHRA